MSTKTAQIDQALRKIIDIRKKVKVGEKLIKTVGDPLQTYFRVAGANGSIAKAADKDLQKVLQICLEARDFSDSFKDKGVGKWKDASWLIENLTEASVGARIKNQQGIIALRDLQTQVNGIKDLTVVADNLADAIMVLLHIDIKSLAGKLTSLSAANPMVWKDIKTKNQATRNNLTKFTLNIDQALNYVQKM